MSLFNRKKKEEMPVCACSCNEVKEVEATPKTNSECCGEVQSGVCCIKVLGAGCASCHQMYENTKAAVKEAGLGVEVEYVTDMKTVMSYGVMSMPALVVNEKVVAMGKVLKSSEIIKLLIL